MAAMNFPLNPNDGDIHDNYVYDATHGVWNANPQQIISRFISSDTAPTNPSAGDGWFDSETGKTYIYHDSSWVESGNPVIGFVDPYDQDSTSTGYFSLPKGTNAQRPVTPSNGDIRFNTESGEPEYYSEAESSWFLFRQAAITEFSLEYLVVAGGGGGGQSRAGGGGAGGYRSNFPDEPSGGGAPAESSFTAIPGTAYTITVGAGGTGATDSLNKGVNGEDSVFATISSDGGGGGGSSGNGTGSPGGSGGGAFRDSNTTASGTANQGFDGGPGIPGSSDAGGGGGGAADAGGSAGGGGLRDGGNGVSSSITGSSVPRGGGGGGGGDIRGVGGTGGGGNGGQLSVGPVAGSLNTGGGGGGGSGDGGSNLGANGGSGVVIIKYPTGISFAADPGLVHTTNVVTFAGGDFNVTEFTDGTGTIIFG